MLEGVHPRNQNNRHSQDGPPRLPLMSSSTTPEVEELDDEDVPKGTVQSRIRRLHRAAQNRPSSPPSPISKRERNSERSGWGAKFGVQARFIQPATHGTAIEVKLNIPRPTVSSSFQPPLPPRYPSIASSGQASPRTAPRALDKMGTHQLDDFVAPDDITFSSSTPRPGHAQLMGSSYRPVSSHSLASSRTGQGSYITTPTGRREAARKLFEQYGISRPSG